MRKKFNIILPAAVVVCFVFLAIASSSEKTPDTSAYTTTVDRNTGVPKTNSMNPQSETAVSPDANNTSNNDLDKSSKVEIPAGGLVLFDEADIVVTVTGVERNRDGYVTEIEFIVENNGFEENNIRITPNTWSVVQVNNLTFKEHISARVLPGKRSTERLRFDSKEVEMLGLTDVYNLTIQFQTDDQNDSFMMQNIVVYEPSTVLIADGEPGNGFLEDGQLVFSGEEADVYAFGLRSGFIVSYADFIVHNKTERNLRLSFGSICIDGFPEDGIDTSEDVFAGTYRVISVSIDDTDISEIEFVLREEEFRSIVSLSSKDIGLVSVCYAEQP